MQVGLNTRIEHDVRVRLDAQVEKEKRAIDRVVAEALLLNISHNPTIL